MELCRRASRCKYGMMSAVLWSTGKAASASRALGYSSSLSEGQFSARTFASVYSTWQSRILSARPTTLTGIHVGGPVSSLLRQQKAEAFDSLQVRYVYVEVVDNDIDAAIKVYKRKMNNAKIDEKLKEKQFYVKPSERRKLAKHYKKLNRARRELSAKLRTAKNQMEKIREVRRRERQEKRDKAAAVALAEAAEVVAKAKASQKPG